MDKQEFKTALETEYLKWKEFVQGDSKNLEVPFFPVASFDRSLFTEFVTDLVSKTIAPDFNMLSVITERGKPKYMLVESVRKGKFTSLELIETDGIQNIKKKHNIFITKSVERSVLEKAFELEKKYARTKDKRTYVLELIVLLANALKTKKLVFSPAPKIVKSLLRAIKNVKIDLNLLIGVRDYLASVEIVSDKRSMYLDVGTPIRIIIKMEHLVSIIDSLENIKTLSELIDILSLWFADGFKNYSIKVEPGSFIWRGIESLIEHDAERIGRKTKFMLSMLADPLYILVMVGAEAYLLEFRKGVIYGMERVEAKDSLKETWLDISRKHGFVHLAFRSNPEEIEKAISHIQLPQFKNKKVFDFYPENEFISHLNDIGSLDLIFKIVYPFVKS